MLNVETTKDACGPIRLRFDGELVIQGIAEMRTELLSALDAIPVGTAIEVDLSEVESVDTTGVQLIMSMLRHVRSRGGNIEVTHHSPSTFHATEVFGLQDVIGVGRM